MVEWGWTKKFLSMITMEKHTTKRNTTSENITYLVDTKKVMWQHEKLHPLKTRRGKCIPEKNV